MPERNFYREEIFFTDASDTLSDIHQDKIIDMLARNYAVGAVGGYFEEGYPVYFISQFALNVLRMTFQEFMEQTGGRYMEVVCPEDRSIFAADTDSSAEKDVREYRVIDSCGKDVWVNELRTESATADGKRIWICAVRLIDEAYRNERRSHKAFEMMKDAYFRISSIDLKKNAIKDLKLIEEEKKESAGAGGGFKEAIALCAKNHVDKKDQQKFINIMDAENLMHVFSESHSPIRFTYRRLVEGKWKWVRSEVTPVDDFGEKKAELMWYVKNISEEREKEEELTERLLEMNAKLEQANRIISETNVNLLRTLSQEEQYRLAVVSNARFVFHVNVTQNLIEEEFYEIDGDTVISVLPQMGLTAPCNADEFFRRWCERNVSQEDRKRYSNFTNMKYLKEAYRRGKTELTFEFESRTSFDRKLILRHVMLLTKDPATGDILALNNAKDITEEKKKEKDIQRELLAAYEAANRASNAKSDFLSKMSHDMHTPMNAIMGLTAIAGTKLNQPEELAECLNKITAVSGHLISLINEVLDMSKIESGTFSLYEEMFGLSELMEDAMDIVRAQAMKKNQKLEMRAHDLVHEFVISDKMRIQQVFLNILSNAVKYTGDGGKITVDITEKPSGQVKTGYYEFVFRDNGIGMTPEFLEHIYEPFERAEDVRTSKIQGTGLGMAITKNILCMMGGTIQIESKVQEGTAVTVGILMKYGEENRAAAGGEWNQYRVEEPETAGQDVWKNALEEMGKKNFCGKRVLLVEDNDLNREIAVEILGLTGITVETAVNGKIAVDMVERSESGYYDLILMDIQMPVMNGYEAARAIRNLKRRDAKAIPIIAVTANAFMDDVKEAKKAGMNAHLAKPLDLEKLGAALSKWIDFPEK